MVGATAFFAKCPPANVASLRQLVIDTGICKAQLHSSLVGTAAVVPARDLAVKALRGLSHEVYVMTNSRAPLLQRSTENCLDG